MFKESFNMIPTSMGFDLEIDHFLMEAYKEKEKEKKVARLVSLACLYMRYLLELGEF